MAREKIKVKEQQDIIGKIKLEHNFSLNKCYYGMDYITAKLKQMQLWGLERVMYGGTYSQISVNYAANKNV